MQFDNFWFNAIYHLINNAKRACLEPTGIVIGIDIFTFLQHHADNYVVVSDWELTTIFGLKITEDYRNPLMVRLTFDEFSINGEKV